MRTREIVDVAQSIVDTLSLQDTQDLIDIIWDTEEKRNIFIDWLVTFMYRNNSELAAKYQIKEP